MNLLEKYPLVAGPTLLLGLLGVFLAAIIPEDFSLPAPANAPSSLLLGNVIGSTEGTLYLTLKLVTGFIAGALVGLCLGLILHAKVNRSYGTPPHS